MKTIRTLPVLLAFALLVGCATDPASRLAQTRASLTFVENSIGTLHDSGIVSDDDVVAMDGSVKAARLAIEAAEGVPTDAPQFDGYLDLAESILERLIELQQEKSNARSDTRWNSRGAGDHELCHRTGGTRQTVWQVYARAA